MRPPKSGLWFRLQHRLSDRFAGPLLLMTFPGLSLGAYWMGGEVGLIVMAVLFPLIYLVIPKPGARLAMAQMVTPHMLEQPTFETVVEERFQATKANGQHALTLRLRVEDFDALRERHGAAAAERLIERVGARLIATLRSDDAVASFGGADFAVCTCPIRRLDLELSIQLATRVQAALEEPIMVDGLGIYVTAAIGFCPLSRAPAGQGAAWLDAAERAMLEALRFGPGAIRAFTPQMEQNGHARAKLSHGVLDALDNGQIRPWFQPQLSTDTGHITGFEALARWIHPDHGMIPPADFLPLIEQAGHLEHLADVMIQHSLSALKKWEAAGTRIPQVGVNFAGPELNNPRLVDKVKWQLDRFDLTPDRLAVEVLETVVSNPQEDMITRNLNALNRLGCAVDLDDFGTGNASIASIRRFSVNRIKIDRSFVMKADRDPDQQRMITAILTMAEQLQIDTLAEGVETPGEHALLAQLGCAHVQGFGIAHPMPFEDTLPWITAHQQKLPSVPRIMNGKSG